jgi:trans-aconitate 2-methyltransferase
MATWDPRQYLRFRNERTQPSIDLAAKVKIENPSTVIDIGCGPGNSTHVLFQRWPNAKIIGLDSSSEMIEQAKKTYPNQEWLLANASRLESGPTYDVVFSNAALQWIPDHNLLLPRLLQTVSSGGALAVQVPANDQSPLHKALVSVSSRKKWSELTAGCEQQLSQHAMEYYYNVLYPIATSGLDLWETTYYHVLSSHEALIEWFKGTRLRPYMEKLSHSEDKEFMDEILAECRQAYEVQGDGNVLFPFRRIFFVAYK